MDTIISILTAAVRAGTPILMATQGEIVAERSGNMNLGIEGMMLIGAMFGFSISTTTGSAWLGLLGACICAMVFSLIHAVLTVTFRVNQVVSGLSLNFLGTGLSSVIGNAYIGQSANGFQPFKLGFLGDIPVIGSIFFNQDALVYLSYVMTVLIMLFLYKTRAGMALRSVGDNPFAADAAGLSVNGIRYGAVAFGGFMSGMAGAYISLAYTTLWQPAMTAGKGWIAVALVIFAQWNPAKALYGAYLFGGITALQLAIQIAGATISPYILQMLPYVFTILALCISMICARKRGLSLETAVGPAALGKAYYREGR